MITDENDGAGDAWLNELNGEEVTPEVIDPEPDPDGNPEVIEPEPDPDVVTPEVPAPPTFALDLPADLFSAAEMEQIEDALGSFDNKRIAQANIFISRRTAQYEARASQAAQDAIASVPQEYMSVHGNAVRHYLSTMCEPHRRSTPEAVEEAQAWALHERAKQIGFPAAVQEAARLTGTQETPAPVKPRAEKPVIPPENNTPRSSVNGRPEPVRMTRQEYAVRNGLAALGLPDDSLGRR